MSVMNASYASPTADAAFAKIVGGAPDSIVARVLEGINGWTIALTLLLTAVLYDQGRLHIPLTVQLCPADTMRSLLPQKQGHYRRTYLQDSIHWTFS